MELSVIIPAFNEEKRLGKTLEIIKSFLDGKGFEYEVIVVDDGSGDNTVKVARESALAAAGRLKLLSNEKNRGKGYSVRRGISGSCGRRVLFSDADLSTPITEMDKLSALLDGACQIAIGSRSVKDSDVKVHQPLIRQTMGKVFNLFVKILMYRDYNDTQCGFKMFDGDTARSLVPGLKIDGFCFDVELIYLARKKGYKVKEAGVVWENSPESKVDPIKSSMEMFLNLFRIKLLHW